jgi:hypothetical protein
MRENLVLSVSNFFKAVSDTAGPKIKFHELTEKEELK